MNKEEMIDKVDRILLRVHNSGFLVNKEDAKEVVELCQPKWISVDTELPEGGTEVLAAQPHGGLIVAYMSESQKKWYDWEGILRTRITHWQYLPDTPVETARTGD